MLENWNFVMGNAEAGPRLSPFDLRLRRCLLRSRSMLKTAAMSLLVCTAAIAQDHRSLGAAVKELEAAVAQSPSNANAHYELGAGYGRLAEQSNVFRQATLAVRARDQFLEAVRLNPDHLEARFSLVQYYTLAP